MAEKITNYQFVDLKNGSYLVKKYICKNANKVAQYQKLGQIELVCKDFIKQTNHDLDARKEHQQETNNKTIARSKKNYIEIVKNSLNLLTSNYYFKREYNITLSEEAERLINEKVEALNHQLQLDSIRLIPKLITTLYNITLDNNTFTELEATEQQEIIDSAEKLKNYVYLLKK